MAIYLLFRTTIFRQVEHFSVRLFFVLISRLEIAWQRSWKRRTQCSKLHRSVVHFAICAMVPLGGIIAGGSTTLNSTVTQSVSKQIARHPV